MGMMQMMAGAAAGGAFVATISSNQQELNLATWAAANGWNGSSEATITIDTGVYIWSDNTAVPALTTGNFPAGLTVINNGYIMGRGGDGPTYNNAGLAGGNAISLGCNCSINNGSGHILGGGGSGGWSVTVDPWNNGSGAGGGAGGGRGSHTAGGTNNGGAGGAVGQAGSNGILESNYSASGGGGGRVHNGTKGAIAFNTASLGAGGGTGGAGGSTIYGYGYRYGGVGGGWGEDGSYGVNTNVGNTYAGGAAGKAVARNGYTPTWISAGTVYGADS